MNHMNSTHVKVKVVVSEVSVTYFNVMAQILSEAQDQPTVKTLSTALRMITSLRENQLASPSCWRWARGAGWCCPPPCPNARLLFNNIDNFIEWLLQIFPDCAIISETFEHKTRKVSLEQLLDNNPSRCSAIGGQEGGQEVVAH